MTDSFRRNQLAEIAAKAAPGMILHIGAGEGAGLSGFLATGASRVVLVEADPKLSFAARKRAKGTARTEVFNLAVSGTPGTATLTRLSMSAQSGLRRPTGLKELFPGLREEQVIDVETVDVETMLLEIGMPETKDCILVLDARGEEMTILDRLIALERIELFSDIFLSLPSVALFAGAANGAALRELLEANDYRQEALDASDRDIQKAHFRIDRHAFQLRAAEAEIIELRQKIEALLADQTATEEAKAALGTRLDEVLRALEAKDAQHGTALEEADSKIEALRQTCAEASAKAGTLQEANEMLKAKVAEAERHLSAKHFKSGYMVDAELSRLEAQLAILRMLASTGQPT